MTNNHRKNIANRRTTTTISKDIRFRVRDSQNYLKDMAKETLPFMYRQSIDGMQQILLKCWDRFRKEWSSILVQLGLDAQTHNYKYISTIARGR